MTLTLVPLLLVLALGTGWVADRCLARAAWQAAAPSRALWTWHAAALTFVSSLTAAAVLLAHDVLERALLTLTAVPKERLHVAYAGPREIDGLWNLTALLVLVGAIALVRRAITTRKAAAATQARLDAHPTTPGHSGFGTIDVSDSTDLYAFSTPARTRRASSTSVVVSRGVLQQLSHDQVDAVLAHEFSHVRRHHHRQVAGAEIIAGVVGLSGALASYPGQVRRLVEMQADDDAAAATSRRSVARALFRMSETATPGLAMSTGSTADRVHRLLDNRPTLAKRRQATWAVASFVPLVLVPPLCVIAPLLLV